MSHLKLFAALTFVTLLSACGEEKSAPVRGPSEVTAIKVVTQETPVSYEYTAQTESSQLVEIRTRVSGFLDKRMYKEGAMVRSGQTLFQIDRKPFEAQLAAAKGELSAQQARHSVAQATLARVKPLVEQNALSKKDLDDSVGNEHSAQAAVEVARANVMTAELNLGYTTIKSPLNGLASSAKIQDGSYLNANSQDALLTTVAALDPMRVVFSVSENSLLKYREAIAKGLLKAPSNDDYVIEVLLADGSVYPERGRLTFADTSYSQGTGTILLRAEVANPKGALMPGQFVRARLLGASYPKGILVPQKAIQQSGQGYFVWTIDKDNKAQTRPIEVGNWMDDKWLILGGLHEGDTLIVDGFMRLAPGVPVKQVEPKPAAAPAPAPAPAK
jgi:membrane fusion protein (multidrug efflux system)